jgi:hypothetical protein
MKVSALLAAILALTTPAHADFSYKTTRKATGGTMTKAAGETDPQVSRYYFKGQKMKIVNEQVATILDFDAHTVTSINNATRSYAVRSFGDVNAATKAGDEEVKADSKDTGRNMFLNGFDASDLLITIDVAGIDPFTRQAGKTELHLETDTWLSTNVPGSAEVNGFHRRNAGKFPWAAMGGPDPGEPGFDPLKRRTFNVDSFLQCFDWIDCGYSVTLQAAVSEVRRNMALQGWHPGGASHPRQKLWRRGLGSGGSMADRDDDGVERLLNKRNFALGVCHPGRLRGGRRAPDQPLAVIGAEDVKQHRGWAGPGRKQRRCPRSESY